MNPGQAHESKSVGLTLGAVRLPSRNRGRPRTRPRRLAGDKDYSHARIRRSLRGRGIRPVIPTRADRRADPKFDRERHKQGNVVERCMGLQEEGRRVGTRHEKLAVNSPGMFTLAMIRRCLRILESPNRTWSDSSSTRRTREPLDSDPFRFRSQSRPGSFDS